MNVTHGVSEPSARPTMPAVRWLGVLMALLPAVLLAWQIKRFAVDAPIVDEWSLVSDIDTYMSGTWSWHDVFRSHNGHRIAVPRLIMVPLAALTGWDTRAPMVLSYALALLLAWMLLRGLGPGLATARTPIRLATIFLGSVAVFSSNQYESWLWGFMVCSFLGMAGIVGVVSLLSTASPSRRRIAVAAALAILASYSHGPGLLAFPIGTILLALGSWRTNLRAILAWSALGAAVWVVYFIPIAGDVNPMTRPFILDNPLGFAYYTITALGAPVVAFAGSPGPPRDSGGGFVVGLLGLLVAIHVSVHAVRRKAFTAQWARFSAGTALIALFSAALTALGRGAMGPTTAYSSRYMTWSTPLWLVALVLLARFSGNEGGARLLRWLAGSGLALLGVGIVWSSATIVPALPGRFDLLSLGARGLYYGSPEPVMMVLMPHLELIHMNRPILIRRQLSVFRQHLPPLIALPSPLADYGQRIEVLETPPHPWAETTAAKLAVRVTNTSSSSWPHLGSNVPGAHAVRLASRWWKRDQQVLEGARAQLPFDLAPGDTAILSLCVVSPPAGHYRLEISLIQESVAWFSDHSLGAWRGKVEVVPTSRLPHQAALRRIANAVTGETCE